MQDQDGGADIEQRRPVIESASATTDHDNNKTGAAPVVIAVVGLVVMCGLWYSLTSCTISAIEYAIYDYGYDYDYDDYYDYDYDEDSDDLFDWYDEDFDFDDLFSSDEESSEWSSWGDASDLSGWMSDEDALESYLSVFVGTVADGISSVDYAGHATDVAAFCQDVSGIDSDANTAVKQYLRVALQALEDEDQAAFEENLGQAKAVAQAAANDLEALDAPASDDDAALFSAAQDLRDAVAGRWEATVSVLDALENSDYVKATNVFSPLESAVEAAKDATEALASALTD